MHKQIILFYQHISREMDSCISLKRELEQRINCVVRIFSIDFEYYKAIKSAKKHGIDLILLPWCHHAGNYGLLVPFIKINRNLLAVNLHHEQIGTPVSMNVLLPKDEVVKNNIFNFCWGDFYKLKLKEQGIIDDMIYVTGNIRLDNARKTCKTKENLHKEFQLHLNKKWILFAECRDSVWTFGEKDIEEMTGLGCDRADVLQELHAEENGIRTLFSDIKKLPDSFFEKYELIYRPHPGTICPLKADKRIKVISQYSIYEWLVNIDYYLTSTSTSIFEAESLDVPCYLCETVEYPSKFLIYGLDRYSKMTSILDFEDFIKEHSGKYEGIYKEYIGEISGTNVKNTAIAVCDILDKQPNFAMEIIKVPMKERLRKWLYNIVTRISCKMHFLELFKFPRSAYREKNDIPYYNNNLEKFSSFH